MLIKEENRSASVCLATVTKYHGLSDVHSRTRLSPSSGGRESEVRVPARPGSETLFLVADGCLPCCSSMAETDPSGLASPSPRALALSWSPCHGVINLIASKPENEASASAFGGPKHPVRSVFLLFSLDSYV